MKFSQSLSKVFLKNGVPETVLEKTAQWISFAAFIRGQFVSLFFSWFVGLFVLSALSCVFDWECYVCAVGSSALCQPLLFF